VPDSSTCADALTVLRRHGIELPALWQALDIGRGESVKLGDPRLAGASFF